MLKKLGFPSLGDDKASPRTGCRVDAVLSSGEVHMCMHVCVCVCVCVCACVSVYVWVDVCNEHSRRCLLLDKLENTANNISSAPSILFLYFILPNFLF